MRVSRKLIAVVVPGVKGESSRMQRVQDLLGLSRCQRSLLWVVFIGKQVSIYF